MKLVFAHDHKLRFHEGRYFTTGGLSNEVLGKYLDFLIPLQCFVGQFLCKKRIIIFPKLQKNG